jgi:hypothetical protein
MAQVPLGARGMMPQQGFQQFASPYGFGNGFGFPQMMMAPAPAPVAVAPPAPRVKTVDNPDLMWYMFNQGTGNIFGDAAGATLWNMGAANAFGGDVPDSAMLVSAIVSPQDQTGADSNMLALMTAMGMGSNPYYNGQDGLGFVNPQFMGQLLRHGNAVPRFDDNYLGVLMTSGVLGLGTSRSPFSLFGGNSDLFGGNNANPRTEQVPFASQMAFSQGMFGRGMSPGSFGLRMPAEVAGNSGIF